MRNLILATTLALTMLTAAGGMSMASGEGVPDEVLGVLAAQTIVNDHVVYIMATDPVRMTVDECLTQADKINNDKGIPYVMFCQPEIRPALTPAI